MKVSELMTRRPSCATPEMVLSKVAKMMADENVGSVPVVESKDSGKIVGVVTDRDIVLRAVARAKNPLEMSAGDVMTKDVVTVHDQDDVQDVARLMEKHQVRRVPVVDENGKVCGIVAQADIALKASDKTTADVVQSVSKPSRP